MVKVVDYDAFGQILSDSNPALFMPIAFAGGLRDKFTGLVRFLHRDYDPTVGRFTAPDPLGDTGGDHDLYDYCVDDPVGRIDLEGLQFIASPGAKIEEDLMNDIRRKLGVEGERTPPRVPPKNQGDYVDPETSARPRHDRIPDDGGFSLSRSTLSASGDGGEGKEAQQGAARESSQKSWEVPGAATTRDDSKPQSVESNEAPSRPTFSTHSTMTDAEREHLEKVKSEGWGIAFDSSASIGVGVGESDPKSRSDGAGYGVYFGSSPSGEGKDGGLEAGSFRYRTHGAIEGAKVGAGYNVTIFDTSPKKFLEGETGYNTWTAGPGSYTVYHDIPTGERLGWGLSVGGKGYGVARENGVSKGERAKITR